VKLRTVVVAVKQETHGRTEIAPMIEMTVKTAIDCPVMMIFEIAEICTASLVTVLLDVPYAYALFSIP